MIESKDLTESELKVTSEIRAGKIIPSHITIAICEGIIFMVIIRNIKAIFTVAVLISKT